MNMAPALGFIWTHMDLEPVTIKCGVSVIADSTG